MKESILNYLKQSIAQAEESTNYITDMRISIGLDNKKGIVIPISMARFIVEILTQEPYKDISQEDLVNVKDFIHKLNKIVNIDKQLEND